MIGSSRRILWTLTLLASSTTRITAFTSSTRYSTSILLQSKTSNIASSSRTSLKMSKSEGKSKKINNIVVVGGGIQGTSVAYQLSKVVDDSTKITVLEAKAVASAASGKGGGFMARSWGDGSPTQRLHELAFDMYEQLAVELQCQSYRKLPVLSVSPGRGAKLESQDPLVPSWLQKGNVGKISPMGYGDDTAQITPQEFCEQMLKHAPQIEVVLGKCTGVETTTDEDEDEQVTGVKYMPLDSKEEEEKILAADVVVVSAGPWSCQAEGWFSKANLQLPMEGIKSTSIVWEKPSNDKDVDATALFCGENHNFGTHLEVYPRPDGTIYICGIGGSDYISTAQLKEGAFLETCEANPTRVEAAQAAFRDMAPTYQQASLQKSQACMRPCPPDAMPYMGAVVGYKGAYLNAGHNCWGIAWAPACGKAMAELIMEGSCKSINLKPFDPARFTPKVSQRGRKRQGTNIGEQW